MPPKLLACIGFFYKVVHKIGCLRKFNRSCEIELNFLTAWTISMKLEAQWQIGYGVGLRIKRSSVWIRPWPLRWVLGQGSLLPLSQGKAFTLASISYLAILVKYILAKKKKIWHTCSTCSWLQNVASDFLIFAQGLSYSLSKSKIRGKIITELWKIITLSPGKT